MSLEAIAKAYTNCVELEERAREASPSLAEDLAVLRADLHALLMEALRQAGIPFGDRAAAAHIAFDMARGKKQIA